MSSSRHHPMLLVAVTAAGCDALVDGTYLGEPLLELEGTILTGDLPDVPAERVRMALMWSSSDGTLVPEPAVRTTTSFPAGYHLELFHPPPEHTVLDLAGSPGWRVAVAHPVLFVDDDGDGAWHQGVEPLVGGSLDTVVLYAHRLPPTARRTADGLGALGLVPGFQTVAVKGSPCNGLRTIADAMQPHLSPRADLIIGNMWPRLHDWDCDARNPSVPLMPGLVHLDHLCPPSDDIAYLCDEAETVTDPYLADCLDRSCDDLDDLEGIHDDLGTCPTDVDPCDAPHDLSVPADCLDRVCTGDTLPDPAVLTYCPEPEEMLFYCKFPDMAEQHGVHESCMKVYCDPAAPAEAPHHATVPTPAPEPAWPAPEVADPDKVAVDP